MTNPKYKTAAICAFFAERPDGIYSPVEVREEIGIPPTAWRQYAKGCLYPENSPARKVLAEHGVTIRTDEYREGDAIIKSVFKKKTTNARATQD